MSIVCLAERAFSLVRGQLPCTRLTCKTPVSSRSPRSFTKTRSLRDSRMRSNGSWIPLEEASMLGSGTGEHKLHFVQSQDAP